MVIEDVKLGDLTLLEFFDECRTLLEEKGTEVTDYTSSPPSPMLVLETETTVLTLSKLSKGGQVIQVEERSPITMAVGKRLRMSLYGDGRPLSLSLSYFPL